MKVLCKGTEVPTGDITLRGSLFEYTTLLSFSLPAAIPTDEFTFQTGGTEFAFVPVTVERQDVQSVKYTCYPKGYWEFLQKVSQPVSMDGTVPELLDALALTEYVVFHTTPKAHWVLPAMRGKTLMDLLTRQITAVDGGCPFVYFNLGGQLTWGDVLTECLNNPQGLFLGTLTSETSTSAYMAAVPGIVHITFYDEDTYTQQDVSFLAGSSEANLFRYVADADERRAAVAEMQSLFWRRKVATTSVKFENVTMTGITPGIKVMDSNERQYVVVGYETVYTPNGIQNTLELFPSIIPEQLL